MQFASIEAACAEYLLSLRLPMEQFRQLIWLFHQIGNRAALETSLIRLLKTPWVPPAPPLIASVFHTLLLSPESKDFDMCKRLLATTTTGAVSYLQVQLNWSCLLVQLPCMYMSPHAASPPVGGLLYTCSSATVWSSCIFNIMQR